MSDLLLGRCLPGSVGCSAAYQGCFSLLVKEQRRDPAGGGGEGWRRRGGLAAPTDLTSWAGCVWSWSRGGEGGARVEGRGKGGGSAAIGLVSAAFHEPELVPQGCLCLSFPNCRANDLASHPTLFFFLFVQNAVEPWLKGAKGAYATCRQGVTG